ncbi:16S rRNA (guanine(527)-N(7))-methyltransferase RsmG [Thermochromatium tepidum ATCC 43061]|uniref:Ribosomal RNA small subunit methyltransferase G n=1 Tax=Thermochromatium tepidum ATCC 43061 TaxID=316276 RepID=A0A6I6E4Z5_THETI|nr:16S rRNA (guanine(527)-N(7))-methyltransferase RsmG [Thermochromatium tepidum ATCC 43061]
MQDRHEGSDGASVKQAAHSPEATQWPIIEDRLSQGCAALGLRPTPEQQARLIAFLRLLARWNQAYNLTAVRDPLAMVAKHLLDSLAIAPFLFGETVLDVGTGAGLPGLPLAILAPERRFWLLDSNNKKIRFVRQAVLELGLTNVEPVQSRIEAYRPGRKFSTIVSRAVAAESVVPVLNAGLCDRPGRLLLMKGRADEAAEDRRWVAINPCVHRLTIPFLDAPRHLIELRSD